MTDVPVFVTYAQFPDGTQTEVPSVETLGFQRFGLGEMLAFEAHYGLWDEPSSLLLAFADRGPKSDLRLLHLTPVEDETEVWYRHDELFKVEGPTALCLWTAAWLLAVRDTDETPTGQTGTRPANGGPS